LHKLIRNNHEIQAEYSPKCSDIPIHIPRSLFDWKMPFWLPISRDTQD